MLPMSAFAVETNQEELSFAVSRASSCITKSQYVPQQGVTLSNPIPQYESITGDLVANVYLIFDGSKHIGLVLVSSNGGKRFATAYLCNYPVLETAKSTGSSVVFYQENGCFTVYIDSKCFVLENPDNVLLSGVEKEQCGYRVVDAESVALKQSRGGYYSVNVSYVANDEDRDGDGLCWAAALACKMNYQTGSSLTAMDVYERCYEESTFLNRPKGNYRWYMKAADLYNFDLTYKDSPISSEGQIITYLRQGKPIIMNVWREVTSNERTVNNLEGNKIGHAVVMCGFSNEDAAYYELELMDPNSSSRKYCSIEKDSFNNGLGFSYFNGYRTYDEWRDSYY